MTEIKTHFPTQTRIIFMDTSDQMVMRVEGASLPVPRIGETVRIKDTWYRVNDVQHLFSNIATIVSIRLGAWKR